ncbi:RHS repeat-associated core domain-containing protein [Pseudomonas wadenswilerensis]
MSTSVFSRTPTVTAFDSRGLILRDIAYHRAPDALDVTHERITRHRYDALGYLTHSADPRLHETGLANFMYHNDLAGSVLRAQSTDAGNTITLNDAARRSVMIITNLRTAEDGMEAKDQAVTRIYTYEDASLPGRPLAITEQAGEIVRVTERFVYAGNTDAEKASNLAGACVSHYDTCGLMQTDSISLTGGPLSVTRRFLKDAQDPEVAADWLGEDAFTWNQLLVAQSEGYTTLTTADATGAVLTSTDAKGNVQRVAYDLAGLMSGNWLTLDGGQEKVIVKSRTYSATGQKLREVHGNSVVTTYTYEPRTQRLSGLRTERPAGHAFGPKLLQDLHHEYDPVGNVLNVRNDAEQDLFWRNQKVSPQTTYVYDSLYQLVCATGREMSDAGRQGSGLPASTTFLPVVGTSYTNYTRTYRYDNAGNLTQVRHGAPATNNRYTIDITVSDKSNRGVLSTLAENPAQVDTLFRAGGQQAQLLPGQHLVWTMRNELLKVSPVQRDNAASDEESYRYDADSQRVLKVHVQKTKANTRTQWTRYLPGLELCATESGATETESLQVIKVGVAGQARVRVLHWDMGRPDDIRNDQVRYSLDNLLGNNGLELDDDGKVICREEYYPYGGTAILATRSASEVKYKTIRYCYKERDATGLYYYGYRYYQPWAGRWLSTDPAGPVDGMNTFSYVSNNPASSVDRDGRMLKRITSFRFGEAASPVIASFEQHYRSPMEGQYRSRDEIQLEQDRKTLELLNSRDNRIESQILTEYIEGGNNTYKTINDHMRGIESSNRAERKSHALSAAVESLKDYPGVAFRALHVPENVYGAKIKKNDVIFDAGFMSASAVAHNAINWLETWASDFAHGNPQKVMLIFDETVPKKMAAGGMLPDHLLIPPKTYVKVKEIHKITTSGLYPELTAVRLKHAENHTRHTIKNIFSGDVSLSAIDGSWLAKVRERMQRR